MNSALSKRQLIGLLVVLGLILVLPFSLLLTKQRQEIRKKAAGTGIIQLKLDPETTSKNRGDSLTYTVKIINTSSSPVQIRVAGVELKVSPKIDDLNITQIKCGSALASQAFADISEGRIRLICYKTPGTPNDPLTIAAAGQAGSTIDLGTFQVGIKNTATGIYTFSSKEPDGRNNVPLGNQPYTDLSNIGAVATLTVAGTATSTPGPTTTPVVTSTPGPTVPPGTCPDGDKGNLNCDAQGLINEGDLGILIFKWAPDGPVPTPNPEQHTADIVVNGKVDEGDLGRLIYYWKTQ